MVLELICVGGCVGVGVCVCVHFFEEVRKDFSPSGEERKREKRKEKRISCHVLSVILSWLSYLYFVRDFKRSAAVISTQFQIIIEILIMCTEEYLIAYYKFKTKFSTFSVKHVPVLHLK